MWHKTIVELVNLTPARHINSIHFSNTRTREPNLQHKQTKTMAFLVSGLKLNGNRVNYPFIACTESSEK